MRHVIIQRKFHKRYFRKDNWKLITVLHSWRSAIMDMMPKVLKENILFAFFLHTIVTFANQLTEWCYEIDQMLFGAKVFHEPVCFKVIWDILRRNCKWLRCHDYDGKVLGLERPWTKLLSWIMHLQAIQLCDICHLLKLQNSQKQEYAKKDTF